METAALYTSLETQNRKQEQTAACWGAPLLHAELNCLCISRKGSHWPGEQKGQTRRHWWERGNRAPGQARVSANEGGLAHHPWPTAPLPLRGGHAFHKGMVYFSDSTDVSEGETEAQPQVAEGLFQPPKSNFGFCLSTLLLLPTHPPPPQASSPPPVLSCTMYLVGLRVCAILEASPPHLPSPRL